MRKAKHTDSQDPIPADSTAIGPDRHRFIRKLQRDFRWQQDFPPEYVGVGRRIAACSAVPVEAEIDRRRRAQHDFRSIAKSCVCDMHIVADADIAMTLRVCARLIRQAENAVDLDDKILRMARVIVTAPNDRLRTSWLYNFFEIRTILRLAEIEFGPARAADELEAWAVELKRSVG